MEKLVYGVASTCFVGFQAWMGVTLMTLNTRVVRIETLVDANVEERREQFRTMSDTVREMNLRLRSAEDALRQVSPPIVRVQPSL